MSVGRYRAGRDVFLSYDREDTVKEFVRKLKRDLEGAQLSVWLDEEDIPAGTEKPVLAIRIALRDCKALVVVVTKKYISSSFCKSELYVACEKKKPVFPVIREEGWDELEHSVFNTKCSEGVKYMKATSNCVSFLPRDDYGAALQKLISGLKELSVARPLHRPIDDVKKQDLNIRNALNVLHQAGFSDGDWFQLGQQLIETTNLRTIKANHHEASNCMIETISQWLQSDLKASWEKLAEAVTKVEGYGEATAKAVQQKAVQSSPEVNNVSAIDSTPLDSGHGIPSATGTHNQSTVAIVRRNIRKIKGKFSMLVTNSQERLQGRINVKKLRIFLITMYSSPNSRDGSSTITTVIRSTESLDEMFVAFSEYGLWDYLNYYLLEEIIEEFASDDDELNDMMQQYHHDLTGHILAQKITTYLEPTKHLISMSESATWGDESVSSLPPKQKRQLYKKLSAMCGVNVTDHTIKYVDDLWQSFAKQFALPQPAMILHYIAEGHINLSDIEPSLVKFETSGPKKIEISTKGSDSSASDDYYLSICEQVMRESGAMDQIIMHCIFVGPAGVGKSSLLRRLLRMKLDPKRCSTQAAEKSVQVEIKTISKTAAQVSGLDWELIPNPISQASGLIGQLSTNQQEKHKEDSSTQDSEPTGELSTNQEKAMKEESHSMVENPSEFVIKPEQTRDITEPKSVSEQPQQSQSQFRKAIEFLRDVLKNEGVSGLQQHVRPWTLYLTDSGGQPEFQELLPALVVGPCVFFVVFPLDKDLKKKYEVEYVRPHEEKCMREYLSSLTIQEDIMRSLASIACTKYKDIHGKEVKPRVMLVATFKDNVPEKDRQRRLKELQDMVEETDAYRQGMIVDASETQMVFTINNLSDDESAKDAKEIRDAFQKLGNADDFKVHTPSTWLIFSILVQHEYAKDSVISRQECFELAQECGIKNESEFEVALQFLHKQTGVLHYYEGLSELSQIVIRDPQHLFSRVNQLVEKTFTFKETRCTQRTKNFERGLFSRADYVTLTKDSSNSKLTPSMLLKLLEHLHVVVPLGGGDMYFMPCAIAHLDEVSAASHTRSTTIPPLLITFNSGYCPKGLFGALVACIANKQVQANCTLDLVKSQIHRNQICFTMGLHRLLLRIKPTYIYIEVISASKSSSLSTGICTLCNSIRKLIEENIEKACETLCYSDAANYSLSFICPCDLQGQEKEIFHPAQIKNDPVQEHIFLCSQSKESAPVNPECHVWLPEPNILQHPKSQSVAAGTKVEFSVKATGDQLHFQWQKDCTDLYNGGRYRDTDKDTLRIVKVEMSDEGHYRCIVKGKMPSDEAFLTVNIPSHPTLPPGMLQHFAYPIGFHYPPSQQLYTGDFQQSAQPQYMQTPSMQYAVQFRGQSSGAVQQLPCYYTIPPQQIPHQLSSTGFTGLSRGVAPPPGVLQPGGQYVNPGSAQYPLPQHGGLLLGHQPSFPQPQPSHQETSLTHHNISQMLTEVLDWHTLGTKLGLPFHTLGTISINYHLCGNNRQREEMISTWLVYDTEASWNKLACALDEMGNHTLAKKIRDKYIPDCRSAVSTPQ